jgi:hypothetical protein
MSPAEVVAIVLASLSTGGVVVIGLFVWLGRVWSNRILEADRSRFAAEIEQLKNRLQMQAMERQTRFTRYHERHSEVLEDLYGRLWYASARIADLVNLVQIGEPAERIAPTREALSQLEDQFYRKRIFLSEQLADKIEGVLRTMRLALGRWQRSQRAGWSEKNDPWAQAHVAMEEEVPPILKEIESQFRQLLSVE